MSQSAMAADLTYTNVIVKYKNNIVYTLCEHKVSETRIKKAKNAELVNTAETMLNLIPLLILLNTPL